MIYVKINENGTISAFETTVSDSIKYETIKFEFPKKWQGYSKTAVFRNKDTILNVVLENTNDLCISEDECYIPYEVLKPPYFTVSVFGVFEDSRVTTEEAEIKVIQSGYGEGGEPTEPTPTEYEQLINLVNETKQIAQSVRDDADNGLFMGKSVECDQTYNPNSKEAQSGKAVAEALSSKQDELVSGENIKTINGESVLGKGNIEIEVPTIKIDQIYSPTSENAQSGKAVNEAVGNKQDTLVSGENIKTVNGESVLGQGDIVITQPTIDQTYNETSENAQSGKAVAQAVSQKADTSYLDNNFANAFKKNKTGKMIALSDVSPVEHRLKVKVSSKNLVPIPTNDNLNTQDGSITIINNKDGTYTVSGTALVDKFINIATFNVVKGVTYTLSGCVGGSDSTYQLYIDDKSRNLKVYCPDPSYKGKTGTATGSGEVILRLAVYKGQTLNNFVIKPQLEIGDKITDFEPYVSSQTVTISKIGKNLIPIAGFDIKQSTNSSGNSSGSWTLTNNKDGTYTVNGSSNGFETVSIASIFVKKGETYTLSGCNGASGNTYQLYALGDGLKLYTGIGGIFSATATSDCELRVYLTLYQGQTLNNFVIKPQLEVGDKITDFEPYIEPQTITANADSTVDGLMSISPNLTLIPDKSGVIIDCTYNVDTQKYIDSSGSSINYDFDETYTITEEEATASTWARRTDLNGTPITLTEMQVDFTIPAGTNTGVQYLYFNYGNTGASMRVTEFAYQHTEKERRISVICYKERETYYAIRGYAWDVDGSYSAMQTSSGVRMIIGNFFDCPTKILNGCYFNVASGKPVAGTIVRIRGKRV